MMSFIIVNVVFFIKHIALKFFDRLILSRHSLVNLVTWNLIDGLPK